MLWVYVGSSNRTAVSVHKQFFLTIKRLGQLPLLIRSDKGKETLQVATSQVFLRQELDRNLQWEGAYRFGTSRHNQRIEAWWQQMSKRLPGEWILRFEQLEREGMLLASSRCIIMRITHFERSI